MRPDVRDLECFAAVAEELHFHRAAARLGLSQPALSTRIQRLEQRLGATLLHRSRRGVSLTEAGEAFFESSLRLLADLDDAVTQAQAIGRSAGHRLVLGHVEYMNLAIVPRLVHALATGSPPVEVVRRELYSAEARRGLLDRSVDAAVLVSEPLDDALVARVVETGHWRLVIDEKHPFAVRDGVELKELRHEQLILFARSLNPPLYDRILGRIRAAGAEPYISYHTAQANVGPELVRNRIGLFLVASYAMPALPQGVRSVPVEDLFPMPVHLAWHVDNDQPAIELLRKTLRKLAS